MGAGEPSVRTIRGDGLSVKLQSNEQILEVTGDGCSIAVTTNYGSVKIVGDGCRLRIDRNMGSVEYTGDGGRVLLGAESIRENVKYTGDGGRVRVDGEPGTRNRKSKEDRRPVRRSDDDEKHGDMAEDGGCLGGERMENSSNRAGDLKKVSREGSSKTRIVTTFDYGEKIAKKWLADPEIVIRNLNGVSLVTIAPKRTTIVAK